MKTKSFLTSILQLFLLPLALFTSCSVYDEDDATIIAYLKINDLLESKLSKTNNDRLADFNQAVTKYNEAVSARALSQFLDWGLNIPVEEFPYDEAIINAFNKKYYNEYTKSCNLDDLENDLSAELWAYINTCYTNTIPAKAQNVEEGRYYTIPELKAKYPDYKEVEIEDFSPMEIIRIVENETLFGLSLISDGDINLNTLYTYYINTKEQYLNIMASHFTEGIPADYDTDAIFRLFYAYSANGGDSPYTRDLGGFEAFANDYYETDMFSGEDCD